MTLPLEPEHREIMEELVYTEEEIRAFLNNALRACEWQYRPDGKRAKTLDKVMQVAADEFERWITASDLAMTREELIYFFMCMANHFFYKTEGTVQ